MTDPHEPIWRALASPVRRAIMDLLRPAPLSTSDLVLAFPDLSRFAVMQHLGVLEEAGLVIAHKFGRVRLNCLNPVPLREVTRRWLDRFDEGIADSLITMKARLENEPQRLGRAISRGTGRRAARPSAATQSRVSSLVTIHSTVRKKSKRFPRHA